MTTIRRLIVELGISGEENVKNRLDEIQQSANSLKNTLEVLEGQFTSLGAGARAFVGMGVPPSPAFQTKEERRIITETERAIKEQTQLEKERADKQLEATVASNKVQSNILKALQDQTKGQTDIINQMLEENRTDRKFLQEFMADISKFVDEKLFAVIRQARSAGEVGRPSPPRVRQFKEERIELGQRIKSKRESLEDALELQEFNDLLKEEEILKQQSIVDVAKSEVSRVVQSGVAEKPKGVSLLPEKEVQPFIPEEGRLEVERLRKQGVQFEFPKKVAAEEQVEAVKSRERTDIANLANLSEIEKEILRLKLEGAETQTDILKIEEQALRENRVAGERKERERLREERVTVATPLARQIAVIQQLRQEQERITLAEEAERIRRRVAPTIEREARAERRGFVFTPARRAAELIEKGKVGIMDIGEKLREGAIGFLTQRSRFFQTPEQAAEQKAAETAALREQAVKITETPEGRQIINQTFNFNNPVIDSDERKEDIINSFVLALKRL